MNLDDLVYSRMVGRRVLRPLTSWGYDRFLTTRTTPPTAYSAMRKLFGNSDASLIDPLVARAAAEHPLLELDADPRGVARGCIAALVESLRRDGYVVLDQQLQAEECDALESVARSAECLLVDPLAGQAPGRRRFDESAPSAVRYNVGEADLVASPSAQRLIADESLLAVAQGYLGAAPVQDLVTMWWTTAQSREASSEAAQQFHFDFDRLRFLKFFVYLTDVDEQHGPHVYVRGSHRAKPPALRRDGRHGDGEVAAAYPGEDRRIIGPRGTMFLADTVGLHKGLNLERGHRLVFQTEYATSLFGASYERPEVTKTDPALAAMAGRYPSVFERFEFHAPVGG